MNKGTKTYTIVGRATVEAASEAEAEAIALNSEVDWETHTSSRKLRYALAAALMAPSPFYLVPKAALLLMT